MQNQAGERFLKFSAPFVESTKEIFKVMISTDVRLHSPRLKVDRRSRGDITAFIAMNGVVGIGDNKKDFAGLLALAFTEPVYLAVASRMLGEEYKEYGPDVADVGAEIVNIILGKSKPALHALGIQLGMSNPSTIMGRQHEISFPRTGEVVEIIVESDMGQMFLDLCYQE
jgi:CheY-specific phosphatase CheX